MLKQGFFVSVNIVSIRRFHTRIKPYKTHIHPLNNHIPIYNEFF